jgi:transcription elongation factor GreA
VRTATSRKMPNITPRRSVRVRSRRSIADLEDKLSRAQVIDPKTLSGDKIVFGATVTLLDEDDKPVRYQIVGQAEADAKLGMISYNSPLGRALIGKQVGDDIEVIVPAGEKYYSVDKIEFI